MVDAPTVTRLESRTVFAVFTTLYLNSGQAGETSHCCIPGRFPIPKHFQLSYPDGSKKHISRAERDELLFSGLAKETAPTKYAFTGQPRTFHSFAELEPLANSFIPQDMRRFLPGSFVFEHDGKRKRELMETAGAYAYRLKLYEGQTA